jgi:hypothetical protein
MKGFKRLPKNSEVELSSPATSAYPNHPTLATSTPNEKPKPHWRQRRPRSMPTVDIDPLSFALRPPPGETEEEREVRLHREAEAKARSNRIDELLKAERDALRRKRGAQADVKLLLLGMCENLVFYTQVRPR